MEARKKELPKVLGRVVHSAETPLDVAFDPEVDLI
jgi:hypothetical protein